jgi:SAM-dependent methyltransferase
MASVPAAFLREEGAGLAAEIVEGETRLLRSAGSAWVTPEEGSWVDFIFSDYHEDCESRRNVHEECLRALADYVGGEADRLFNLSEWLRLGCYLYADLRRELADDVQALVTGVIDRRAAALDEGSRRLVRETLGALFAELPRAVGCFDSLRRVIAEAPSTHGSPAEIERYWDVSAKVSPFFTVDWASFGRTDLFDNNGRRAASWLAEQGFAAPSSRVLQIGCGMGRIEKHLAPLVGHAYGVDISAAMLGLAREWLEGVENVTLSKTDGRRLPLPDGSLDTVFSFLVFIHINDEESWQGLFKEAARVLKPGGRFLFTVAGDTPAERRSEIDAFGAGARLRKVSAGAVTSRKINSFRRTPDLLYIFGKGDEHL